MSSRKAWRNYWASDVALAADPAVDMPRITRWIGVLDEYERVMAVFKTARLVKGSTGQPALNPLAAYLGTLLSELKAAENDLGLTPMARLRLGIVYGQARLTAEELNRALDERMDEPQEIEAWEADWEDAP